MMSNVGMRSKVNDWADQREAATPTPKWLQWSTATWPRTVGLGAAVGVCGLLGTVADPDHWGVGDDLGAFLGGVGAACFMRLIVRRRERLRSAPRSE